MGKESSVTLDAPVWREISLCTPPELVEAIANFLIDEEANGVVIEAMRPEDELADRHRMGWLWVRAYFRENALETLRTRLEHYLGELAELFPISEPPILDRNMPAVEGWNQCWQRFFKPLRITSRIAVRPPWEEVPEPLAEHEIVIDPGMAFGTGKHPTTKLCIRALEEFVFYPSDAPPRRTFSVLDVGTGSGILAIAAAKLGAQRVLGIDVDPEAIVAARANSERSGVEQIVEVTDEELDELIERFDVVVANIVAETLLHLKPKLVERLDDGGILILGGLLANQGAWIKAEFLTAPLSFVAALHDGEWCTLVFERI